MGDDSALRAVVRQRANGCCEYCQFPDAFASTPFQIDHIIAEKHGGPSTLLNLAWSCIDCNSFKGPNIAGRNWETEQTVPLYDPRHDLWNHHFYWERGVLVGKTPVGQVTILVLRINLPYRVAVRRSLIDEGVFPPATPFRE